MFKKYGSMFFQYLAIRRSTCKGTFYSIVQLQHKITLGYHNNFNITLKINSLTFKQMFVHLFLCGTFGAVPIKKWDIMTLFSPESRALIILCFTVLFFNTFFLLDYNLFISISVYFEIKHKMIFIYLKIWPFLAQSIALLMHNFLFHDLILHQSFLLDYSHLTWNYAAA